MSTSPTAGLYFLTTFAIPLLRKSPHPSVLNIASVLGIGASRVSGTLTYSVSKVRPLRRRRGADRQAAGGYRGKTAPGRRR
jgi:hypothetical protein